MFIKEILSNKKLIGFLLCLLSWLFFTLKNIPVLNYPGEEMQISIGLALVGSFLIIYDGLEQLSKSGAFDFEFINEHYNVKKNINNLKEDDREFLIEKIRNKEYFFSFSINDIDMSSNSQFDNQNKVQQVYFDRMINWLNLMVEQGVLEYISEYKDIHNYKFTGYAIQIIEKGIKGPKKKTVKGDK